VQNTGELEEPAQRSRGRSRSPRKTAAASNGGFGPLTGEQVGALVDALEAARDGNFSVRLSARGDGAMGEVAAAFNALVERNARMSRELLRVSKVIGREGRITERAASPGNAGAWDEQVTAVNSLIDDLVRPTTEIARVIDAVADGDVPAKKPKRKKR